MTQPFENGHLTANQKNCGFGWLSLCSGIVDSLEVGLLRNNLAQTVRKVIGRVM